MKSTWFKNRTHYEFAKTMTDAAGGYVSNYKVFYDWVEAAGLSLNQMNKRYTNTFDVNYDEKRYMEIIKSYKYPNKFAEAFALMVKALEENPNQDFLGDVFHALQLNDKDCKGQIFTPYPVAQMMALMILEADQSKYNILNRLAIDEPACGAGAMIIAATHRLRELGFSNRQFVFYANDVDHKCVLMTFIQCYLLDIPCLVRHANTLSQETWRKYPTFALVREPLWPETSFSKISA